MKLSLSFVTVACIIDSAFLIHATPVFVDSKYFQPHTAPDGRIVNSFGRTNREDPKDMARADQWDAQLRLWRAQVSSGVGNPGPSQGGWDANNSQPLSSVAERGTLTRSPAPGRRRRAAMIPQPPYAAEELLQPMASHIASAIKKEDIQIGSAASQTGRPVDRKTPWWRTVQKVSHLLDTGVTAEEIWRRRQLEAPWKETVNSYLRLTHNGLKDEPDSYRPPIIIEPESQESEIVFKFTPHPLDMMKYPDSFIRVLNLGVLGQTLKNVQTVGRERQWIRIRNEWYLAPGWYNLVESQIV